MSTTTVDESQKDGEQEPEKISNDEQRTNITVHPPKFQEPAPPTITTTSPTSKSSPLPVTTTAFTKDDKTGMATMAGRRHKVALAPGHSHLDWVRKTNTEHNLSGTNGQLLRVGRKELAKHNTKEDCWMALRGKVYNITPYLAFHPGGVEELMRGAGRDGTKLFDHRHTWVNAESMMAKCLVGIFIPND